MTTYELRDQVSRELAAKGEDHSTEIRNGVVLVHLTKNRRSFEARESKTGEISLIPIRTRGRT